MSLTKSPKLVYNEVDFDYDRIRTAYSKDRLLVEGIIAAAETDTEYVWFEKNFKTRQEEKLPLIKQATWDKALKYLEKKMATEAHINLRVFNVQYRQTHAIIAYFDALATFMREQQSVNDELFGNLLDHPQRWADLDGEKYKDWSEMCDALRRPLIEKRQG